MPDSDVPDAAVVVFLSGDLMFASRIRAAAETHGFEFHLSSSLPSLPQIAFVVVDLSTRSGAVEGLVERCAEICPEAKVIAYGPHVHVDRLDQARRSGIEIVLTRGQFDQALSGLFSG